jgi:hypothetical protein
MTVLTTARFARWPSVSSMIVFLFALTLIGKPIPLRKANQREVKRYGEGLSKAAPERACGDGLEQGRCDDG